MIKIFLSFDLFSSKFSFRDRLINIFSSHFSFYFTNRKSKESIKIYIHKLNKIIFQVLVNSKSVVIILDTSIKNQV